MTVQELIDQLESLKMPEAQVILHEEGNAYSPVFVRPISLAEDLNSTPNGPLNCVSIGG